MRENIIRITTHDTEKTYEFPAKQGEKSPQLWEVELKIGIVSTDWSNTIWPVTKGINIFRKKHIRIS